MKTLHQLENEDRILEFVGEKIAHVSSENNDSIRWLEVNIYATESGGYVYETIGRSVVFRPTTEDHPRARRVTPAMVRNLDTMVLVCDPKYGDSEIEDFLGKYVILEEDRHRATFAPTADGLVESAKVADSDGILFITNTAKAALLQAAERDPRIHDAYMVERV